MRNFKYEGLSKSGQRIEGVIEAFDEQEAATKAKATCNVILSVKPIRVEGTNIFNTDLSVLLGGKIKDAELALLCSQLNIELKAGLPLVKSLQLVAENEKNAALKKILSEVADDVHAGHSLAESFALRGPQLPNTFIATIKAGEESGRLEECFAKLKKFYESQAGVKSSVKSAMIYPILLMIVAVAVVAIIMIFAVPVFKKSFGDTGLPGVTKALIGISDFMVDNAIIMIIIIAVLALGLKFFGRTEAGRRFYSWLALKFPGVGGVTLMSASANFCSTMSTMLSAGIPLVDSLKTTAEVTDNVLLGEDLAKTQRGVVEGKKMGDGLKESQYFPQLLKEMTAVGEETGNLEETLDVVQEYYNKEVDVAVKRMLGILEPAIILVLAGLVVFILLAVYLPLFGMYGDVAA